MDVVCLGILVADVLGRPVDGYPERGKLRLVDRMELHTGGCAANTGISLAKIGIATGVIGRVGRDGFGDFIIGELERYGVNCSAVVRDAAAATSATMVMVHGDGERSFIHYLGANAALCEGDADIELIRRAKVLHIGGTFVLPGIDGEPTARILAKAREAGVTTSLDTTWDSKGRWMSLLRPCLEQVHYFLPSFEEARMLTGKDTPEEAAEVLLDAGVGTVALKLGERGCYIRNADARLEIPGFKVKAVDACGAGDAFAAGFLAGVVRGWDLERTGRFANAVGAMCVTALGSASGVRDEAAVEEFMAAHRGSGASG